MGTGNIYIKEDLPSMTDFIPLEFKVVNPFGKLRSSIEGIVKGVLEIPSAKFWEKVIKWDTTDGSFMGEWQAWKDADSWTKMKIKIVAYGSQDLKTKQGSVYIKFFGWVETKFEYSNEVQKSLWWMYKFIFYDRRLRNFWEQSREDYFEIEEKIKKLMGTSKVNPHKA